MRILLFTLLLFAPPAAFANVVWPALYVSQGFYAWWIIGAGLAIEWVAIKLLFRLSSFRALVVDLVANAGSALLGVVLIPLSGLAYEIFPGLLVNWVFDWGTFNPVAWVGTAIFAAAANLLVESLIIRWGFKLRISRRALLILYLTNLATVLLVFVRFAFNPSLTTDAVLGA